MNSIKEFSENYGMLHDAVIKSLSLSYNVNPYSATISLELECMSISKNDEWVNLLINFHDIDEFKISSSYNIGINSIENFCISFIEESIVFDFIPHIIYPTTINEHRNSLFYIMFKNMIFKELIIE